MIFIKETLGRKDHTGNTKTALHRAGVNERLLNGMDMLSISKPLNRYNVPSLHSTAQQKAGAHCRSIQQDCTGTAVSGSAALLCPTKAKPFTEGIHQNLIFIHLDCFQSIIEVELDFSCHALRTSPLCGGLCRTSKQRRQHLLFISLKLALTRGRLLGHESL